MKKAREPKPAALLARPVRDRAELERLAAWLAERQAKLRERGRVALAAAGVLLALVTVVTASDPAVPASDLFILPAMLALATAIAAPFAVRRWWAQPRLLAAQRRLLRERTGEGPGPDEPEALLADLEERVARAETLLGRERPSGPPDPAPVRSP